MHQHRGDHGMTLVELLVAMVLLTVVVGLATGSLIVALDKQANVGQSTDDQTSTQNAVELMERVVRQAVYPTGSSTTSSIIQLGSSPTQLIVDSRLASTQGASQTQMTQTVTQYTFFVSGTTLSWKQATVTCNGSTCTAGTATPAKVLIRGLRTSTTDCPANTANTDGPFHYVTLNAATGQPDSPMATPTQAQLNTIFYVTLNLFTEVRTGPHAPACTSLADYVQLRNKT